MDVSSVAAGFGILLALLGLAFHVGMMQERLRRLEGELKRATDRCDARRDEWAHQIEAIKVKIAHLDTDP